MSSNGDDSFERIVEGDCHAHDYQITNALYQRFLASFADVNPIHVDLAFAKAAGFEGLVMHGAILNGFLSHFIGMEFPGNSALILSVQINYVKPSFLNDLIRLQGTITHKMHNQRVFEMSVAFLCLNRDVVVARAKVNVAMTNLKK